MGGWFYGWIVLLCGHFYTSVRLSVGGGVDGPIVTDGAGSVHSTERERQQ